MDKRIFAFITCFILLSSCGIGIVAAESSGGNSTVDDGLTDTSSHDTTDHTSTDDVSADDVSTDDVSTDDVSTDDVSTDDVSADDVSTDNTSADNSSGDNISADPIFVSVPVDNISEDNGSTNDSSNDNQTDNLTDGEPIEDPEPIEPIGPEPPKNIISINVTKIYINNIQNVYINFNNQISVVNNINFDAKKASGKTTIVVEDLKDKSLLIDKRPSGNIYKAFNIRIDKLGANDIANAVINFHVEKSWLKENKFDKSAIILNMFSKSKWVKAPVTITGEDTKYVYYEAKVSGYSSFVITAQNGIAGSGQSLELNNSTGNNTTIPGGDQPNKNILAVIIDRILLLFK